MHLAHPRSSSAQECRVRTRGCPLGLGQDDGHGEDHGVGSVVPQGDEGVGLDGRADTGVGLQHRKESDTNPNSETPRPSPADGGKVGCPPGFTVRGQGWGGESESRTL